jgi:hypothetical protein
LELRARARRMRYSFCGEMSTTSPKMKRRAHTSGNVIAGISQ